MYSATSIKQKIDAGSSNLPVCRYYELLQFLHDTVSNDEADGNVDIEFSKRAFPTVKSEVIEGERNDNVLVTHEVTPLEKTKSWVIPKIVRVVNQNKLGKKFQQVI